MLRSCLSETRSRLSFSGTGRQVLTSGSARNFASRASTQALRPGAARHGSPRTYLQPSNYRPLHRPLVDFSGCGRRAYVATTSPSSTSFPDPDRPDLFYHLFHPPSAISRTLPVFALSFIPEYPTAVDSCAVVGWLPAAAPSEAEQAWLNDFKQNGAYPRKTTSVIG